MSIIYCQNCTAWALFNELCCQVCHVEQRVEIADPTIEELLNTWGTPLDFLAKIELTRQHLPRVGSLMVSTTGLIFMPELEATSVHYVDQLTEGITKNSLLRKLWHPQQAEPKTDQLVNLHRLHAFDIWQMPGSFFIAWHTLEKIVFHQKIWSLQQENQRACTFLLISSQPVFVEKLQSLSAKQHFKLLVN